VSAGESDGNPRFRPGAPVAAVRGLLAPDPEAPYWRDVDGSRHSYGSLRSVLGPRLAAEVADAHLAAIGRIAAAALAADRRGDHAQTARLAAAAARLCGEIRGLWPASAVTLRRG
jgi:hypothetical protein